MKKIALLGLLALAGCSSAPPLFTSDGRSTIQISCQSNGNGYAERDHRAQDACGSGGFDVLDRSDSGDQRSVYIACRKPPTTY